PNGHGEIGDGTTTDALRPKKIADNVIAIAAGEEMSLFVKSDYSLWGMGSSMCAELGSLSFDNVLSPVRILDGVRAASSSSGLLIKTDGAAYEFGEIWQKENKEYGHKDYQRRPSAQKILDGAAAVESGRLLRYVIQTDGSLWSWGTNFYGQLGDGTDTGRSTAKKILAGVTAVSTNGYSTLALKSDGTLWAWGMNRFGQLGDGTETDRYSPVQVAILATKELPTQFYDVEAGTYYASAVQWALDGRITTGTSDTTFSPDATCTRAQVVTFLWRASGSPAPNLKDNPFSDVSPDQYYYQAVLWAVEQGITTGTSAETFSPDAGCTRGQVVTFLHRAQGAPAPGSTENPFTDVPAGQYYYDAVLWAVNHEPQITNGTSAATFSPGSTCTRGQIVTFLYRALA
ncbi:MAG: S-layer homology domain-containing protein, partial [Oscillospiraceae bacterium]|nr:S-layer homology domain-containing protein [Oscillospiraceae bacterium]